MAAAIRVTALSTTPVKGLRIAPRERLQLERGGARGDRAFYLIDARGRMINGKHSGALNGIVAELDGDGELTLTFPDGQIVSGTPERGEEVPTSFHSRPRAARLVGGPFSQAISRQAGEGLRLVSAADDASAIDRGARGAVTLISRGSLSRLAEVAGEASVDARRFRMTVELDGVAPFGEDAWIGRDVTIGDAVVRPRGHVGRCIVTSRHPVSGAVDLPTLDLLRSFRSGAPTTEPLAFGVYAEVLRPGTAKLGDEVVLAAGAVPADEAVPAAESVAAAEGSG
jgi:MOSC domain-containing protein